MKNINIPRCYKPTDFSQIVEYTLHHFPDASETGYDQATYSLKMEMFTAASSLGSQE